MGTWSHEPFGNDTANDWAYDLEALSDLSLVESALDRVLSTEGTYFEAPEAEEAVAAAEVLAKMLGQGTQSDTYTAKVDAWVGGISIKPTPALLKKANAALDRIIAENSELMELWSEGDGGAWLETIRALQRVVGRSGA